MPKFLINGFVFIVVVFALWSTQDKWMPTTPDETAAKIIKSPNDQRSYKAIELDNKLEVLLISDPSTDKAAAALDVEVGSSDDPDDFLGLAHFLEHMLFLGTKKYPEADEYQKYISDHGGSHNAFTSLEHTNYFFDINANSLEGALDRFAEQFTSPLFNEEYVEREINAVHSEFSAKIKDDSRRHFSVIKELLVESHPYNKFSVGNLETLKNKEDKSVREALLDFYQARYSANQMKLVILGKEPLETLEKWAQSKFSAIPNKNLPKDKIETPFFEPDFLPAKVSVQSVMDKRTMIVAFPVPTSFGHEESQPLGYLSNLIGHEGKGSLFSLLKSEGLVNSLGAGSLFDTKTHGILSITMELTPKGMSQQQNILNAIFAYIDLIKQEGVKKQYFDEQAKMLEIAFKFQEKSPPIHYVSALSSALQDTESEKVLSKGYQLTHYDEALYKNFLSYLTPDNMFISLSAQDIKGDRSSLWYEAPYQVEKLTASGLDMVKKDLALSSLSLPEENIFIPENTDLIVDKTSTKPAKILDKDGLDLWYAPDVEFGTPKANLFVTIRSEVATESAKNNNLTELMVSLIKDELNEFSYPAYLAGLNYELYKHLRGITIKISGYNDKQATLLQKLLLGMKSNDFKQERFNVFKDRLIRTLNNAKRKKPFEQAISKAQRTILIPSWSEEERLTALSDTDFQALKNFHSRFFKQLDVAMLSTGNVTQNDSLKAASLIEKHLLNEAEKQAVERSKVIQLSGDKTWYKTLEVDHPDTGFIYYLQGDNKSFSERAMFLLLSQILSTDYYASIRTEQQLGYIVFATNFSLLEVPALAFIIQSPVADGDTLLDKTKTFLDRYLDNINDISQTDFDRFKAAVISRLLEKENTLYQRSTEYWQEIDQENFNFDSKERLVAEVENIDLKSLTSFYQNLISKKGKGLAVYSVKTASQVAYDPDTSIDKAALETF